MPVKNETDRSIRFKHVRPSCSCAGATRLAAMELAPGQETTLTFEVDLRHRKGPQRFLCYLVEADGSEWTYTLETTLHERARFRDADSLHFGMIDPKTEEARDTEFVLHSDSLEALPDTVSFRADSDQLRVEAGAAEVERQSDGTFVRRLPVRIRLQCPDREGLSHASIYAEFDRQGEKQRVQLGVTWNVRTLFSVSPAQAYFGTVDTSASGEIVRRVMIRRTDGKSLSIKGIKTSCPPVRCSVEKAPEGSACSLALTLDPRKMNGPLWGEVIVETDHAVQPFVKIPVAALAQQPK